MSEYAELKARLRNGVCQDQNDDVEIWETEQLMKQAAAAIDALEREVEQLVAERNDIIKQLERFAKRHQDHLVMGAQVRQRAEAAEARVKRLEDALLWCSGSNDFNEGGVAEKGWLKVCAPLLAAIQEDKSHE